MQSLLRFFLFAIISVSVLNVQAQKTETTIILLRHAEKDTAGGDDPNLSAIGWQRAKSLTTAFKDYLPDEFYATPYKRTKQTLTQWAEHFKKQIKMYDPNNIEAFATELKAIKGKTIVVAGHSNTTPALVNLLLGASKYPQMDDKVYNQAFVVTINNDVVTDKVIEY